MSDEALLRLFSSEGDRAWSLFLERYGARLVGYFRALGYNRDQAMDRFVALCDRLRDQNYRRLRELERVGRDGELVPWLLTVAKRVATDLTVAELGRQRLPRSIETMSHFDRRVFELYFWSGIRPSELCEQLGREENRTVDPIAIFDALERVLQRLSSPRIWRLVAQRSRAVAPASLVDDDAPEAVDPETSLLERERFDSMRRMLELLSVSDRTLLRLRYGEGLGIEELARQVGLESLEVSRALRRARRAARRVLDHSRQLNETSTERSPPRTRVTEVLT